MKVEITINDENGKPVLLVSEALTEEFVRLDILDNSNICKVHGYDLELALRKLKYK